MATRQQISPFRHPSMARGVRRRQLGGPPYARQSSSFLYSANKLPTTFALGDYDFFTAGVGIAGSQGYTGALTNTETNLQTGRRIPDQSKWKCRSIGLVFQTGAILADIVKVLDNTYLWFEKPDYKFVYGPGLFYPGGCGVAGVTTQNNVGAFSNGMPQVQARVKLNTPIILDPGETFAFHLNCTSAQTLSTTVVVWLTLFGDTANEIVQ